MGARRRLEPGERVGVLLTEGDGKTSRFSGSHAMRQAAGIASSLPLRSAKRFWDVSDRAKRRLAHRMGGEIVKHWRADGISDGQVRYTALVIERPPA